MDTVEYKRYCNK